jgi:hypothetical protein
MSSAATNIVELVEYSEKSVAVFGHTQPYRTHFTDIGGKFNPALTKQGQKCPGWIFSKKQQTTVQDLVNKICKGQIQPSPAPTTSQSTPSGTNSYVDRRDFMALLSRVEHLEQSIGLVEKHLLGTSHTLSVPVNSEQVTLEIDDEDREDPNRTPPPIPKKETYSLSK